MATIRKRGKRYQVQVRRHGFAPVSQSFLLLSDAKEWAREMDRRADRQELSPIRTSLSSITLRELVERYRDDVIPTMKGGDKEWYLVNAFARHPICRKTLAELSTKDFAEYRDERLQSVTPKSVQRGLSSISHMFEVAREEWGMPLKENPLSRLRIKVVDNKRQRRLRTGELALLLKHAASGPIAGRDNHSNRERNAFVPIIVQFALETAMRRGEILALRWGEVDLERASLTVLESKNGYSRVLPVTNAAASLLE